METLESGQSLVLLGDYIYILEIVPNTEGSFTALLLLFAMMLLFYSSISICIN